MKTVLNQRIDEVCCLNHSYRQQYEQSVRGVNLKQQIEEEKME